MKTIRALVLDFDDVITNSEEAINAELERNGLHEATSTRHAEIQEQVERGLISKENAAQLERKHFTFKDRVLEEVKDTLIDLETGERTEVNPEDYTDYVEENGKCYVYKDGKKYEFVSQYAGLIDYTKVINLNTVRGRNLEYCRYLAQCGYFDQLYIESHYNSEEERIIKDEFIKKYLKGFIFIPVLFHKEDYAVAKKLGHKRSPQSKAGVMEAYIKEHNIDRNVGLYNFTLVDDSASNRKDWKCSGGTFIRGNKKGKKDVIDDADIKAGEVLTQLPDLQPLMLMSRAVPKMLPASEEETSHKK